MKFRELQKKDLKYMEKHSQYGELLKTVPSRAEYSYTLEHSDSVLCIGGFIMVTPATYWAWFAFSDKSKDHIISIYRVLKEWSEIFCKDNKVRRLMAFIEVGKEEAVRTAEHLGFRFECRMSNFLGDQPADLYSRLLPENK